MVKMYATDINMMEALWAWYRQGLYPGSCAEAIIDRNYALAEQKAHPDIKILRGSHSHQTALEGMYEFFGDWFPWFILKGVSCNEWTNQGGLLYAEDTVLIEHKLIMPAAFAIAMQWRPLSDKCLPITNQV